MKNELDKQAEAGYLRDRSLINGSVTPRQVYVLGWLQGRVAGLGEGMEIARSCLDPEAIGITDAEARESADPGIYAPPGAFAGEEA